MHAATGVELHEFREFRTTAVPIYLSVRTGLRCTTPRIKYDYLDSKTTAVFRLEDTRPLQSLRVGSGAVNRLRERRLALMNNERKAALEEELRRSGV